VKLLIPELSGQLRIANNDVGEDLAICLPPGLARIKDRPVPMRCQFRIGVLHKLKMAGAAVPFRFKRNWLDTSGHQRYWLFGKRDSSQITDGEFSRRGSLYFPEEE
jgi:hypothetical protein